MRQGAMVSQRAVLDAAVLAAAGCAGATAPGPRAELVWAYRSNLVNTPPTTWDELIEVGRWVGERNGITLFVADGAQYEGLVIQYLEYFWSLGGDVLGRDGQSVLFQPDKARRAAEFMGKAFHFYKDPDSQVAGKVGTAPLPTFAGFGPVAALDGHNLAVSAFSRNIPAATDFVRFVSTSRDMQLSGYASGAGEAAFAGSDGGKPRPATPEWFTMSAELQQRIFAAYTGDREPTAATVEALWKFLVATVQGR